MAKKEYIDKVAFNNAIRDAVKKYPNSFYNGLEVARQIAHDFPAADVRPVCRGKLEKANGSYCCGITEDGDSIMLPTVRCSACKKLIVPIIWKNFCPNCGADMREANDEKA